MGWEAEALWTEALWITLPITSVLPFVPLFVI
jgi:hypothetical protein